MRHYEWYHYDMSSFILVEKNMSKTNIWFEFLLLKLQNGRNFDENIKKNVNKKWGNNSFDLYLLCLEDQWKIAR